MLTGEVPFKGDNQVAVAMKHVREPLPDVQRGAPGGLGGAGRGDRPATAKRHEDRYADDAELIADLEDVLAIETARAGSATGEVTSVLRTLPAPSQRRVPFRLRHRTGVGVGADRARGARRRRACGWPRARTTGPGSSRKPPPSAPKHALSR